MIESCLQRHMAICTSAMTTSGGVNIVRVLLMLARLPSTGWANVRSSESLSRICWLTT